MTGAEVQTDARRAISDSNTPYRWTAENMLPYANDGRREIVHGHPEARYVSSVVTGTLAAMTGLDAGDDVGLLDRYKAALVHYVAYTVV